MSTEVHRLKRGVDGRCRKGRVRLVYILGNKMFFVYRLTGEVAIPMSVSFVYIKDCKSKAGSDNIMELTGSLSRSVRGGRMLVIRSVVSSNGALCCLVSMLHREGPTDLHLYALLSGPSHHIGSIRMS